MKYVLLLGSLLQFTISLSQQKYWATIQKETSLEYSEQQFRNNQVQINNISKWLHAISIHVEPLQVDDLITNYPFIENLSPVQSYTIASTSLKSNSHPSKALEQINAHFLNSLNLTGEGIKIGITDAGFTRADSSKELKYLFQNKQVKAYKDFVSSNRKDFYKKEFRGDYHGKEVWKRIAGYDSTKHIKLGLATGAHYYLARTENADKEQRIEEDNWIAAIEWLDSLGVRLINTSLGYSHLFDKEEENYSTEDMDGQTALISKFAHIATQEKGLFIVVSAGNEGRNNGWKIITAPADVKGVFSIGATKYKDRIKANYSSIGPDFLNYNKPDIACYSSNGTSYSAPIITGLVACIMQHNPLLSNDSIKTIIKQSSHLRNSPNNYLGSGIPNCKHITALLQGETVQNKINRHTFYETKGQFQHPEKVKQITIFHKFSNTNIAKQTVIHSGFTRKKKRSDPGKLISKRKSSIVKLVRPNKFITQSTIDINGTIHEVIWESTISN